MRRFIGQFIVWWRKEVGHSKPDIFYQNRVKTHFRRQMSNKVRAILKPYRKPDNPTLDDLFDHMAKINSTS
jgi:hypothetical protein